MRVHAFPPEANLRHLTNFKQPAHKNELFVLRAFQTTPKSPPGARLSRAGRYPENKNELFVVKAFQTTPKRLPGARLSRAGRYPDIPTPAWAPKPQMTKNDEFVLRASGQSRKIKDWLFEAAALEGKSKIGCLRQPPLKEKQEMTKIAKTVLVNSIKTHIFKMNLFFNAKKIS